ADLVVGNGEAGVNPELAKELAEVPGVRQVESMVDGRVRLPDLSSVEQPRLARVLGVVWKRKAADSNPWNVQIDWAVPPENIQMPETQSAQFLRQVFRILDRLDAQVLLPILKQVWIRPIVVGQELANELPRDDARFLEETIWPLAEEYRPKLPQFLRAKVTRELVRSVAQEFAQLLPPGTHIVRIQTVGQAKHILFQVGTARAEGPLADLGKSVMIMHAPDAAELLHIPGLVTRLDVFLE